MRPEERRWQPCEESGKFRRSPVQTSSGRKQIGTIEVQPNVAGDHSGSNVVDRAESGGSDQAGRVHLRKSLVLPYMQ